MVIKLVFMQFILSSVFLCGGGFQAIGYYLQKYLFGEVEKGTLSLTP